MSNGQLAIDAVGTGAVNDHQLVFIVDPATLDTHVIDATDGAGANAPGGTLYTVQA
jgi:hypothetical protein